MDDSDELLSPYERTIQRTKRENDVEAVRVGRMTGFRIFAFDKLDRVPEGRVVTVPQLARWAGVPGARDGTRRILNLDDARSHPYWRVVGEDGGLLNTIGGGPEHQREKLEREGVSFRDEDHVDLEQSRLRIETVETEENQA